MKWRGRSVPETWSLSEGLGRIRWGDHFATLRRVYSEAYGKLRRLGRNPRTGELLEATPGEFDEELVVAHLAIGPEFPEGEYDFETRLIATVRSG